MPCLYDGPHNPSSEQKHDNKELKRQNKGLKKELDESTSLLCELCRGLPEEEIAKNKELHKWWKRHQKEDAKRLKREAAAKQRAAKKRRENAKKKKLKEQALDKLSKAEKAALGL